jgi:type IV secretory pathway TraG/TraD family ATPase VirD4
VFTIAAVLWVALELGHRYGTGSDGTWLPGNPFTVIAQWFQSGRPWNWIHSATAITQCVFLLALLVYLVDRRARKRALARHVDGAAQHMGDGKDLTEAAVRKDKGKAELTAIDMVGLVIAKAVQTGELLYAGWRSSMTAIMGTGSGKTTALAIRLILRAPGSVYYTSNKRDVFDCVTWGREQIGKVWTFDPQEIAGLKPTWWWNPLSYVAQRHADGTVVDGAEVRATTMADLFADASKDPEAKTDAYFDPAARELMSYLLLAAACADLPITQVLRWANKPNKNTPVKLLRDAGFDLAADLLDDTYELPFETKRGVFGGCKTVLRFLNNRKAIKWVESTGPGDARPQFDPYEFVRSTTSTLGCLSKEGQGSFGPLVAAFTMAITEAAEAYADTCGGRLDVPLVVMLDEAANVCRIKGLPDLYSHYGSRGICLVTILQSRAQGEAAWGKTGIEKMLGASTHELLGRGLSDMSYLKDISDRIGTHDVQQFTTQVHGGTGMGASNRTVGTNWTEKPILTPAQLAALPDWRGVLMASGGKPVLVELIPYWNDSPEMKASVEKSKSLYAPKVAA